MKSIRHTEWCRAVSLHFRNNQLQHEGCDVIQLGTLSITMHAVSTQGPPLGKMTDIFMIISAQFIHTILE